MSENLDWLWGILGTQWDKLTKYRKKKVGKFVNKSPENYHKRILTLKGSFVDSTVSIMILLLVFILKEQCWEDELMGSSIKHWEKIKVSHCSSLIPSLSLFLFCIPPFIWKHYKLPWFIIISCHTQNLLFIFLTVLKWCTFIYPKALSRGPNNN